MTPRGRRGRMTPRGRTGLEQAARLCQREARGEFVVLPPMLQLEDLPDENEYTLIGDPYRGETVTASRETAATKSKAAGAP